MDQRGGGRLQRCTVYVINQDKPVYKGIFQICKVANKINYYCRCKKNQKSVKSGVDLDWRLGQRDLWLIGVANIQTVGQSRILPKRYWSDQ